PVRARLAVRPYRPLWFLVGCARLVPGTSRAGGEVPEDVVVAGGGVVARQVGQGERVQARGAAVGQVQPAALAESGPATTTGRPARGRITRDRAAADFKGRSVAVVDAAAEAVATVAAGGAGTAHGLIVAEKTVADRGRRGAAPEQIRQDCDHAGETAADA